MTEENSVKNDEQADEDLEWLRKLLTENVASEVAHQQLDEIAVVYSKPSTKRSISSCRSTIEGVARHGIARNDNLKANSEHLDQLTEAWKTGGGDEIRSSLDESALEEIKRLAAICAELNLSPDEALVKESQITALGKLVEEFMDSEERVANRYCALVESQAVLRTAAEELKMGKELLSNTTVDVEQRQNEGAENAKATANMMAKAAQYEERAAVFRERIKQAGFSSSATHEMVVKEGETLNMLETQVDEVAKELEKYHDLPPDIDACRQKVDEMHLEIRKLEEEIQNAINAIVK